MYNALMILILTVCTVGPLFGSDVSAGKAVYDRTCKACHGPD